MSKLFEMNTVPRMDLKEHQELKDTRPNPVGIADSCIYQYEGTNLVQWWVQRGNAKWYPHDEPIYLEVLDTRKPQGRRIREKINSDPHQDQKD